MLDKYSRNIDYIRISVTDRCNLRCVYCMPEDGVELVKHDDIMIFDEIIRICKLLAEQGFKKVKLTGGEPLVRKDLPELVRGLKKVSGIEQVTLTTNGILLEEYLEELAEARIDGINISLDTLEPEIFAKITRRDEFDKVWRGIEKTLKHPEINLKINCVPIELKNEDLLKLVSLAKDNKIHVRFIEMMPIGYGKNFEFLSEDVIREIVEAEFGELISFKGNLGNGPSHYYTLNSFVGKIGFISAISHKFCHECNRIRLTSQGFLKTCLQYDKGVSLLEIMRSGADDRELNVAIEKAILNKPMEHDFLTEDILEEEKKSMSQIGG